MEEIRLRILSDEGGCWKAHFNSWNNQRPTYKNITIVTDDSYTHLVVYNLFRHFDKFKPIPKENVVGFITEPYQTFNLGPYQEYAKQYIGTYYCHDAGGLDRSVFKNGMPFLGPYCGTEQMIPPHVKGLTMSMVASSKNFFPGHQIRHLLIKKILSSNLNIDIFGRDLESVYGKGDSRIKGSIDDVSVAYNDYKFTIAVENVAHPYWVTEKFYNSIMCSCIPVYWGASAIDMLYSSKCHVSLPNGGSIDHLFSIISNLCVNHHAYGLHNVEEGQRIIKEKQNLPEFLWRHFNGDK